MKLPSEKERLILEGLRNGTEKYGLELVKESEGQLKRGSIYVLLDRLEIKGFITDREETVDHLDGMRRRYYRITGLGLKALAALDAQAAIFNGNGVAYG